MSVLGLRAQGWSDITASKLTNSDLSSLDGWTATGISGGDTNNPVNVRESFHQTGWSINNPTIALTQSVTLNAGKYVLKGNAFHRGLGTANLYVKVGENDALTTALPLVGNDTYKSEPDDLTKSAKAFEANSYVSFLKFEVENNNSQVTLGITGTNTADYDWFCTGPITLFEVQNEISTTYPLELTETIDRGYNGWTYEGTNDMGNTYYANVPVHQTYKTSALGTGNVISREYTGLDHGIYEIEVFAQGNCAWGASSVPATAPEVFANSVSKPATCLEQNDCDNVPTYTLSNVDISDGNLNIGFRNTAEGGNWYLFNIKSLKMTEPYISVIATEISAATATALAADKWYKFTAASTDNFTFATTAIDEIVYTSTDQRQSTATGDVATTTMALTEGTTYYIKSSSDQTLTITPQTFTYTVGEGTPSVANNSYTQAKDFTLTFADYYTDDPAGTFQILDASKIQVNGAAATATLTDNVLTITLANPLATSTDYEISVAAGALGFNAENANAAIDLTVKTPAVIDGHYYIKKDGADLFFSRGGDDNKQVVLDQFGVPVKITTDASNMSRVKFIDTGLLLGASGSSNMYWTDKGDGTPSTVNWTIAKNGNKFKFYLMSMEDAKKGMNIDGSAPKSDTEANACDWELELPAAHPAKLQAVKDAQAATVASAMSIDGVTTQAQMAAALTANFGETAIAITGVNAIQDKYQNSASTGTGSELALFAEETVNGLAPGLYRLRVYGFERIAGGQTVYDAGGAAGLAYVYATSNSVTEKVKLASLFDVQSDTEWKVGNDLQFGGKYYANGTDGAQAAFDAGNYANDVYVQVVDEGEGTGSIKFGIKQPNCYYSGSNAHNNGQWICYNNFSLVLFEAKASDSEKTALANAITAAEAKTLGFETGEYAPYTNVAALEALAAAKAIDPTTATSAAVTAATTALTGATWNANAAEVNAISNGTFSGLSAATIKASSYNGWTSSGDNGIREIFTNASYPGLNDASNNAGMYVWGSQTYAYGNTVGYTMPLKANTIYEFNIKFAGQAGALGNLDASILNASTGMAAQSIGGAAKGVNEAGALVSYSIKFVTGDAGNYVLSLSPNGNAVFTDMTITKAASQVLALMQDGSTDNYAPGTYSSVTLDRTLNASYWNTFCVPFAIDAATITSTFGDGTKVREFDTDVDVVSNTLTFKEATAIAAGKPYLIQPATTTANPEFTNVAITSTTGETVTKDDFKFIGVVPQTAVKQTEGDGSVNYFLNTSNNIVKLSADGNLKGMRAYFNAPAAAGVKLFISGEDMPTCIESLGGNAIENGTIFNLAGQRVNKVQKGIFIVNGKKVVR